jgi:cell division protease FtsH
MRRWTGYDTGYLIVALIAMIVLFAAGQGERGATENVAYSEFERRLAEGEFDEVTIGEGTITGRMKPTGAAPARRVSALLVDPALAARLTPFGVALRREAEPGWARDLLSWTVPTLVFFGLWWAAARRMADRMGAPGGLVGIGRSRARVSMERQTGVRFDDVAGVDEAKAELQEVVEFLRDPREHGRLGARVPKGILLVGPTGTGKTLLARAVAGETGVAFFSISGSEFIELFVGVGAARVRDLFDQARRNAPAIIFIDELDALGKTRGAFPLGGGHDEREQTLNQLLVELDGFDPSVGVVLLAATNRPEILDPALLRAGRFDRQVLVDRPDRRGRLAILRVHARRIRMAADVDLDAIAALTPGLAGADLANLVNEAALAATRRRAPDVGTGDFTIAFERIVAGIERRTRVLNESERRTVAFHELGHALTALSLPGSDRIHKISIIPHGLGALGHTLQRPGEDRYLARRSELMTRIAVLMGGRAAEALVLGEVSTGAADDIAKATEIARDMVMRHGMDEGLGCVAWAARRSRFLDMAALPAGSGEEPSPDTARRIDEAVRAILQQGFQTALAALRERRDALERCARALIERETLDENDIRALLDAPAGTPAPTMPQPSTDNMPGSDPRAQATPGGG